MAAPRVLPLDFPASPADLDYLPQAMDAQATEAMLRECLAEAALRRHLQRVHDSHYASDSPRPRALFRIG